MGLEFVGWVDCSREPVDEDDNNFYCREHRPEVEDPDELYLLYNIDLPEDADEACAVCGNRLV